MKQKYKILENFLFYGIYRSDTFHFGRKLNKRFIFLLICFLLYCILKPWIALRLKSAKIFQVYQDTYSELLFPKIIFDLITSLLSSYLSQISSYHYQLIVIRFVSEEKLYLRITIPEDIWVCFHIKHMELEPWIYLLLY